ncbi:MAG: hypothetical protein CMJ58_07820 [Planctomycetaceae bacterium]|nr:hypothetical protein [Planctomycetaceae bacterium]
MHLARYAASPLQHEVIQLAECDYAFVRNLPVAPASKELNRRREELHIRLKQVHKTVKVEWNDAEARLVNAGWAIELTAGIASHVLFELSNETNRSIDLSIRQAGDEAAPGTRYVIPARQSQLIPARVAVEDLAARDVTLQLSAASATRRLAAPIVVRAPASIRGALHEAGRDALWPGRVYVLGSDGVYHRDDALGRNETLSVKQLLQFFDDGRFRGLPFFYSDGRFELQVPPGRVEVTLERGFEHELTAAVLDLEPGEARDIDLESGRLVDMKARGWISGDTHVHWVKNQWNVDLPLDLLATVQRAEDLRVANNLTLLHRRANQAFINPSQAPMGTVAAFSDRDYHVEMGEEYRNQNLYGHLCFLNLDWLVMPIGTGPEIAGDDTLDYPLNKTAILACREQGGIICEAHGLGANHEVPVNVVHDLTDSLDQMDPEEYYNFLDCGFQLPLTNGSDHPARVVGCARAYVKVEGDFTYDKWIDGIRQGRTFTTSGPLLLLEVNDCSVGDTLTAAADESLEIRVEAISRRPLGVIQIVSNGKVLKEVRTDESMAELTTAIPAGESRWIVARCAARGDDYNAISGPDIAHTSAIYIEVDGQPRFVETKARRWIARMKQHIRDIKTKGRFANDQQMEEAIEYVRDGIRLYEQLIAARAPETMMTAATVPEESDQAQEIEESTGPGAETATWPTVKAAEPQPLSVQVERLVEALDYIGNPLPQPAAERLRSLSEEDDPTEAAKLVQEVLDPFCIAAVEIDDARLVAVGAAGEHELVEQGWRSYLVKVCNRGELTTRLHVESPNARSMPHARQQDVASRWLGLTMFDGRPLQPNLSGLELEYRIVQLYSRDAGPRTALMEFAVDAKPGRPGRQIREWRFDAGADGWQAANQSEIEVRDGSMYATGLGGDPFITAEVGGATGELILRFAAETDTNGVGEVFWWTEERPQPDAERVRTFPLIPGGVQNYEVVLPVEGVLAGVRIDPDMKRCKLRFDWIDLSYARRRGETWGSATLAFRALPAVPVKLHIADKPDAPAVAALEIRDRLGRVYPEQSKRLAPDLFFHPQIYRRDGDTLRLPPGEYAVRCWRGPHSIPETHSLQVGDRSTVLNCRVRRWIDPAAFGWWCGDHHIHAAGCLHYVNPTEGVQPSDMLMQTMGEDLNVGCCLTWGPCFDYQKQFFTGSVDTASEYPYLLRYDVEVSGFGSHVSGHLNLLRLHEQIPPGGDSKHHWPTLGLNTLRWAKRQGAVCGPAHSANGLTEYVGRVGDLPAGPHGLPHYRIPAYDGIGANEFIVDVTHRVPGPDGELIPAIDFISAMNTPRVDEWNMWYHTLNCGYRVRVSGETDFPCMSGERVGIGRVYVKVDGRLNFADWVQGIQDGRSYVSDGAGHILDFEASIDDGDYLGVGEQGSELTADRPVRVTCRAQCAARLIDSGETDGAPATIPVELVVNGYPAAHADIRADGTLQDVQLSARISRSSWVALRLFPHAHANPFFVIIDEKPIRASRASAEWCLRGVDRCWTEKESSYAPAEHAEARAAYDHAREAYRAILAECIDEKGVRVD